jgi:UDP:flavonoid glycosyltransferase YjiC (YdhE family)
VLHAGIPQIIIPHIGDQWFFAREMKRLRVGLEVKRKKWPEQLPKAVKIAERSKRLNRRSKEVAKQLAEEDGPANAVCEVEEMRGLNETGLNGSNGNGGLNGSNAKYKNTA